ncbi:hypothetical protein ACQJBY_053361 [Aegilops geniculata]
MASEEEEFLFGSYTEDEEDLAAAEAKEQRAKRRAEGEWGIEKVIAKHKEQQMELRLKYLESLKSSEYPSRGDRKRCILVPNRSVSRNRFAQCPSH